ncbi:hypothetical protein SHJG_2029 [Streptomyces hygroscopicus subsp. jinggangensis 5008]|nr:hypothetical protein SHJG_2029 [Streptomyces hygroscopicus subsp. jinggangensis 5008]AGF61460.1 hypothetical protein SHJGH_1794 [Streptomyces hygroscopicus subsp. jinggangensis TL01]
MGESFGIGESFDMGESFGTGESFVGRGGAGERRTEGPQP